LKQYLDFEIIKKMAAICTKCGELIPASSNVCYKCGLAKGTIFVREGMKGELSEVTHAVRDVLEATPAEQRDKTIGKQNWKTFETNSQRTKGQTVEESMAEIDRFVAQGHTDDGRKIEKSDTVGASTKLGSEIQNMLGRNGIKAEINSYAVEGGSSSQNAAGKAKQFTEVTETHYEMEGEKKDGLIAHNNTKFAPMAPGSADAFLNQYKNAEAAKYKPGYANRNPNGVN